ncbi:hypothetical protein D3C78_1363270 [compost metagenome]
MLWAAVHIRNVPHLRSAVDSVAAWGEGKPLNQLVGFLRLPTKTPLAVAAWALDHPGRMFNLGSRLGLGLQDLANRASR